MSLQSLLLNQLAFVTWADDRCMAAAETVAAERWDQDFGFSFGSVHATLVHMLGAQQTWLDRLAGRPEAYPKPADLPTLADIRTRWQTVHVAWQAFLSERDDAALAREVEFVRRGQRTVAPLQTAIHHVLDHATHHRGQLNSLIKLAGGTPGEYGYMVWAGSRGEAKVS